LFLKTQLQNEIMKNNRDERIHLAPAHKSVLEAQFGITRVAVNNALKYKTNSYLARAIRRMAKELLLREAERVRVDVKRKKTNYKT